MHIIYCVNYTSITCACCFIFSSLYLIFNLQIFLAHCLLVKIIDFVLSSLKWILNLLSTNQSQIFSKSSLSIFSITCACCFIFSSLYLIFSLQIFLALCLLVRIIDLVLSSLKWILNLLSTNQSQIFSKSSLSIFSITCACCFIFSSLYLIFSLQIFLALCLLVRIIDLVLSSLKWILNLLSTNQSQIFSKFS